MEPCQDDNPIETYAVPSDALEVPQFNRTATVIGIPRATTAAGGRANDYSAGQGSGAFYAPFTQGEKSSSSLTPMAATVPARPMEVSHLRPHRSSHTANFGMGHALVLHT